MVLHYAAQVQVKKIGPPGQLFCLHKDPGAHGVPFAMWPKAGANVPGGVRLFKFGVFLKPMSDYGQIVPTSPLHTSRTTQGQQPYIFR